MSSSFKYSTLLLLLLILLTTFATVFHSYEGDISLDKATGITIVVCSEINHFVTMLEYFPDSKVHGANMGSIWSRQDPGVPHVGPMSCAILEFI